MAALPLALLLADHPAAHALAGPGERLLRVGPSGVIYGGEDSEGRPTARKVFECGALTRCVQYVALGSAAPYAWNEHAVRAALLRRRILSRLMQLWFPGELRVAYASSHGWDARYSAYELHVELVNGRPPQLPHPLRPKGLGEAEFLRRDLLPRLQAHLLETGFDGMLWPAGLGNPVALGNFLLEETKDGGSTWVWVDLESGVPALFPGQISALWRTYLPLCRKHGRVLFDDVDVERLEHWLAFHGDALDAATEPGTAGACARDVEALNFHQEAWRKQPRRAAAIAAQLAKGRLDAGQAEHYEGHALAWYSFEVRRLTRALAQRGVGFCKRHWPRIARLPWRRLPAASLRFLGSQRYREAAARDLVRLRIRQWHARGQLSAEHAEQLSARTASDAPSTYLADFGVHLAMKPFVKGAEYVAMPLLYAGGFVDEAALGLVWLFGGCVARTVYTAFRCAQEFLRGRAAPWLALLVGALPVFGNLAFPLQIVRRSQDEDELLASFLLFDGCALIGRRLPIWGGRNTWTEHALGSLARRLTRASSKT
ncbi:MAG: hypothetical protein ACI8QC_000367 [Planctomycetota bacterium]|jgi:hypothetical protein